MNIGSVGSQSIQNTEQQTNVASKETTTNSGTDEAREREELMANFMSAVMVGEVLSLSKDSVLAKENKKQQKEDERNRKLES